MIFDTDILNADIVSNLTVDIVQNSLYEYIENTLGLRIGYAKKRDNM